MEVVKNKNNIYNSKYYDGKRLDLKIINVSSSAYFRVSVENF